MYCEECHYLLIEIEELRTALKETEQSLLWRTRSNYKLRRTVERLALEAQIQKEHMDPMQKIRRN